MSRRVDVVSAQAWASDGIAAALIASVVSGSDGGWEALLDSDDLVYVLGPPVTPLGPLVRGPFRPEPL